MISGKNVNLLLSVSNLSRLVLCCMKEKSSDPRCFVNKIEEISLLVRLEKQFGFALKFVSQLLKGAKLKTLTLQAFQQLPAAGGVLQPRSARHHTKIIQNFRNKAQRPVQHIKNDAVSHLASFAQIDFSPSAPALVEEECLHIGEQVRLL